MTIIINNAPVEISEPEITVKELVALRNIPEKGTAIALNDKLIPRSKWDEKTIKENDEIVVISAAFGG